MAESGVATFNIGGVPNKERSLDWYKTAVLNGMNFQYKYAKSSMWPQYKAYYRHEFPDGTLPVNMIFSVLRSMVPQVYFRNPHVTVTPTKPGPEHEFHARLVEDIDNWLLRELSVKYEMKKMINDAFLCGTGTGFIGYDSQFGYSPSKSIGQQNVASITQFDKQGNRIEYQSQITPGMPWFLRARPEDVIYPWGCESAGNAMWTALRVFRPLKDVQADPKYKNTSDLKGSYVQSRTIAHGAIRDEFNDGEFKDFEWVELFELHDTKTKEIVVFTMDHDKFLRKEEDVMQVEGLPVQTLVFNPDPDFIYGIPDARIIEPQLLELNEVRTQAMKHRRVDILKFLYKRGSMTKEAMDRLLSEDVQAGVEINADSSLRDAVIPLNPGASGILADLERMGEVIRGDVREMVGFSRSTAGEYQGKTHISAAETGVVSAANQIRLDERRDIVADVLTNIIRKLNQIIFTHWTEPMVRSVVGPDGAKYWLKFKPSEIKGEYGLKIDPSNAIPVTPELRKKEANEMAQAYATMNMGLVKAGQPIPPEIQRYFFGQYEGLDVDKLMAQIGQGAQAMMAQQGAGRNPGQPIPPAQAAQQVQQGRG